MMRSRSRTIASNGSGWSGGVAGSCFLMSPGSVRAITGTRRDAWRGSRRSSRRSGGPAARNSSGVIQPILWRSGSRRTRERRSHRGSADKALLRVCRVFVYFLVCAPPLSWLSCSLPCLRSAQPFKGTKRPDVRYVPSPDSVVEAMLELARVTASDVVYDLGSGDGRIPIAAAQRYGAIGVGVETRCQAQSRSGRPREEGRRQRSRPLPDAGSVRDRHQPGDRGHAVPAAAHQPGSHPQAEEGAQARHADRALISSTWASNGRPRSRRT